MGAADTEVNYRKFSDERHALSLTDAGGLKTVSMFEQPLTLPPSADKQDILSSLIDTMRRNITPQQGISAASDLLFSYYNCQGAILKSTLSGDELDFSETSPTIMHDPFKTGPLLSGFIDQIILPNLAELETSKKKISLFHIDTIKVLVCYQKLRQNERAILLLWRKAPWQKTEEQVIAYFWEIATLLRGIEDLYLTAIKKTRHDPATGVIIWSALRQTIMRRLPRLDRDGLAGTLILLQINGLSALALAYGPEMEEKTLKYCVSVIEYAIRPTDSVGRIGGPFFVIWLDGADRYAAAERAETLTRQGITLPFMQKTTLSLQMGLCCREPSSSETVDDLLEQATLALKITKPGKSGPLWHFAHQNA